jgi:hypothetical protein
MKDTMRRRIWSGQKLVLDGLIDEVLGRLKDQNPLLLSG